MDSPRYLSSLKSIETENIIDRMFYRPVGYVVARLLQPLGVTPNVVTIVSIFIGASSGYFFFLSDRASDLWGILLLVIANILDCVDGQLARLTGKKTTLGRILDGVAGDIWFIAIYVGLAMRLSLDYGSYWLFLPVVVSGLSHLVQSNVTDYYKTLHLFFISREKGADFQSAEQVKHYGDSAVHGLQRLFYEAYKYYTKLQESVTPQLQKMLITLRRRYADDIPQEIRIQFRRQSKKIMRLIDLMTFNGRSIVLFAIVWFDWIWLYLLYETIFLNLVLMIAINRHERMCAKIV
ncbi:MAG: CDP-alcohol phosphatidyltransferase family protein [Tannerellaceae bacterium]|nr:CDP-alcohol phosphatidyltransferase family protein [Tannerellaceae bacterium]